MLSKSGQKTLRSERIRSPALYLREIEVFETTGSRGSRFSGTRFKNRFIPAFLWLVKNTPTFIAMLPVHLLSATAYLLYPLSVNPVRKSCQSVIQIAKDTSAKATPIYVYRQYLANFVGVLRNYIELYRSGADAVAEYIYIPEEAAQRIDELRRKHSGVILAVPHNLASAFSGLKLNRTWPMLLVARNSSTVARTKVALTFFERMEVQILMVRGGNPIELSRAIFSALGKDYVVAATLDNISSQANSIKAEIFHQSVAFPSWAAKIAAKRRIPVVPVYFSSTGRQVQAHFGEPLISEKPEVLVQHYIRFFENSIIADPASWAYLADKRWRRVLIRAAQMN